MELNKIDRGRINLILEVVILLCVLIIIFGAWNFIKVVKSEGGQCVSNPAKYYMEINNISNICDHCVMNIDLSKYTGKS